LADVDCILALVQDITDRKQNEQAIVQLKRATTERKPDLEGFTSSVCHDLSRPTTCHRRFHSDSCQEYVVKLDEKAEEYFDHIHAGVRHMTASSTI